MLNVTLVGGKEYIARLEGMSGRVQRELAKAVTSLAYDLVTLVKKKLSGDVLNVRTGKLRDSISQEVTQSNNSVIAKVFSGGEVKYAGIHEFGGTIHHPGGTPYLFDKASGTVVFVSKSAPNVDKLPVTKAHEINMPERSFLRSSLSDMRQQIESEMREAVIRGMS